LSRTYESLDNLQTKILEGVNVLADNVASTLGPKGRTVLIHNKDKVPFVTKDGVTVAEHVFLDDPIQNAAAQITKQAASNTNSIAGDGTTTSTVLTRCILKEAQRYVTAGLSPTEIKRGLDKVTERLVDDLYSVARPVSSIEDVEHIATVSANGDISVGKMIALAVDSVGNDGAISIEDGKSTDTHLDVVEGFRFDSGWFARSFVTDERRGAVSYDNALVLVTDHKVDAVEDILPVLEVVARENKPLIIVAEEVEGQALAALIMNTVRGTMKVAAVKAPRYGEERRSILQDLCLSVGATFISRRSGVALKDTRLEHLGNCQKAEVLKGFTTIMGGAADYQKIEERIEGLKAQIKETEDMAECQRLQDRVTRLSSGVAVIRVGAATEVEAIEKKHRIEDALEAVRAAQTNGVLPGGGTALLRASSILNKDLFSWDNPDQSVSIDIMRSALQGPVRQMAENAGKSPDLVVSDLVSVEDWNLGWDFAKDEAVDMIESGIIDPALVTCTALKNAVSVSSTLITTNFAIVEMSD
tara:strand:- start:4080 stop:5666 length:1587 start_codon:yes stop_codon:yes gene_type:complete